MTIPDPIGAFVPGLPATKGSVRPIRTRNGRMFTKADCERLPEWTASVRLSAREQYGGASWSGPVFVAATYVLPRPKGHYGTGRNAGNLKPSAPQHPTTKPDIDKMERALFDALTHTVIADDSQVVRCTHEKRYARGDEPIGMFLVVCFEDDEREEDQEPTPTGTGPTRAEVASPRGRTQLTARS